MHPLTDVRWFGATAVRSALWSAALLAAVSLAAEVDEARGDQNPPRYQLEVGQKIEYECTADPKSTQGLAADMSFLVVGENAGKSWKLLFWNNFLDLSGGRSVGAFDLFADGRIVLGREWTWWGEPEMYFPRLPDAPVTAETTWKSKSMDGCTKFEFRGGPPAAGARTWSFEFRAQDPMVLHPAWTESTAVFDLERGLIRSAKVRSTGRKPKDKPVDGTLELKTSQLPEEESRQLAAEAAIFFRTTQETQALEDEARRGFKYRPELLDRIDAALAKLDGQITLRPLKGMVDFERRVCESMRKYSAADAEQYGKVLDHPSPDWQTTDLDGDAHALQGYRGKVVLLDFWSRGCLFCIKAMPQVMQLAEDFKDQPVAILGMNDDRDEANARFVIDALGINFPTLKDTLEADGKQIHDKYSIDAFPTLVLIDQQGVVRDILIGYSPLALRDDLASRIRKLLAADENTTARPAPPPEPADR